MKNIWVTDCGDYDTPEEAIKVVEARGAGDVVKFHGTKNNPGCLPEIRYHSSALWRYTDGKWYGCDISQGSLIQCEEEKPH